LFGQAGVTVDQGLETRITLDARHDGLHLLGGDALAVVFAIFAALQQEVGPLGDELVPLFFLIGLLTDMTADHAVNVGDFFEEAGAFLLDGR
jgi:hypothetical protein